MQEHTAPARTRKERATLIAWNTHYDEARVARFRQENPSMDAAHGTLVVLFDNDEHHQIQSLADEATLVLISDKIQCEARHIVGIINVGECRIGSLTLDIDQRHSYDLGVATATVI